MTIVRIIRNRGGIVAGGGGGNSVIEQLAASLNPGDSIEGPEIAALIADDSRQTIQWGNRFFYDDSRGIAILGGKDASAGGGDGARSTNIYSRDSDEWTTSGRFHISGVETGHIYESIAYDFDDGVISCGRWSEEYLQQWSYGSPLDSGWTNTETFSGHWSQNATPLNRAHAYHPNLFGSGDGGYVICRNVDQSTACEVLAYRKSTDSFHSITGTQHDQSGDPNHGAADYCRGGDYAIVTFPTGNTYRIPAGSSGSLATPVQIEHTPLPCRHQGGVIGVLIDDPLGTGGPYILEKGNSGSNEVYRLIGDNWSLRGYEHALPAGGPTSNFSWFVASCYPLGVFWAIRQSGSPETMLYKPGD